MFFNKLYVRIWLAVVLAVAILTLLVGWAWRLAAEPPLREVVMRNEAGQVIGNGHLRMMGGPGPHRPGMRRPTGNGPEFLVRMDDGKTVLLHLPRPPLTPWQRAPFGFVGILALVGLAVALGTYPIIRRLTRRLDLLQNGVQQWGEGNLSVRVPEGGPQEVTFLAQRFNHAAEQIENLVKSRDALLASQKSLLANASHELRSPLTRIRMGLELLGEQAPSLRSEESPRPCGDGSARPSAAPGWKSEIERNIAELDQLIEEILLASRLDARDADLGTVELVDLMGLAAEECAQVDAELEVQLGSEPGAPVNQSALPVPGVAKLLRRALRNLLENAHRHAAGVITVTLSQSAALAELRVCDRGPGVPVDLRERIFEPFYRLPGATERDAGVGLGLALVRSIALRHGGTVFCENRPEGGACFVLQLPLAPPKPAQ